MPARPDLLTVRPDQRGLISDELRREGTRCALSDDIVVPFWYPGAQAVREGVARPVVGIAARRGLVPAAATLRPHGALHAPLQVRIGALLDLRPDFHRANRAARKALQ